jgi:hypothetical protein
MQEEGEFGELHELLQPLPVKRLIVAQLDLHRTHQIFSAAANEKGEKGWEWGGEGWGWEFHLIIHRNIIFLACNQTNFNE